MITTRVVASPVPFLPLSVMPRWQPESAGFTCAFGTRATTSASRTPTSPGVRAWAGDYFFFAPNAHVPRRTKFGGAFFIAAVRARAAFSLSSSLACSNRSARNVARGERHAWLKRDFVAASWSGERPINSRRISRAREWASSSDSVVSVASPTSTASAPDSSRPVMVSQRACSAPT